VYLFQGGVVQRELAASELLADESLQAVFFGATTDAVEDARRG
jgi:hypothetical protein